MPRSGMVRVNGTCKVSRGRGTGGQSAFSS